MREIRDRSKFGRPIIIKTAEELAEAAEAYFKFCEDNPIKQHVILKKRIGSEEELVNEYIEHPKPFLQSELFVWLGISESTWHGYAKKDGDFLEVYMRIKDIIFSQKYSGGLVGLYDSRLIAKEVDARVKAEQEQDENQGVQINVPPGVDLKAILYPSKKEEEE